MATFSKQFLSGSTNGKPQKVTSTSSGSGASFHVCPAGTTSMDEIWLWATNSDVTSRKLTVCLGGLVVPTDEIEVSIPPESGLVLVIPGLVLNNGLAVRLFADVVDVVCVSGYVNRITA